MACDIYGYPLESAGVEQCMKKADELSRKCVDAIRNMSGADQTFILGEVAIRIFTASLGAISEKGRKEMLELFVSDVQATLNEHDRRKH